MSLQILMVPPEPALADALERFELGFTYPLGANRLFRISHGRDYPQFFRAIGGESAASFIATARNGEVIGTLGVAIRPLQFPTGQRRLAAYLGDLRTAPGPSRGRVLLQLSVAATTWSMAQGAMVAYGVVMGGTQRLPDEYTGRMGMYAFEELHALCMLRLPVLSQNGAKNDVSMAGIPALDECFRKLCEGSFAPLGGSPNQRSEMIPQILIAPDGTACGLLEDTRRAKRLIDDGGQEMLSAHLSQFAYRDPVAGARLIRGALDLCARRQLAPALFVAVPAQEASALLEALGPMPGIVRAPATVYGTELRGATESWRISSAEI